MTERRAGLGAPFLAGALVVGIGFSVRSPITSVAALLPEIDAAYGLGHAGVAMLSTIPVLLFGLAAPIAPPLVRRLGADRAAALLLSALAVAMLLRPLGAAALLLGTVVVGASISLLGILTPQLVRTHLGRRHGLWSGVYTAAFGASAALGASFAVPVFSRLDDAAAAIAVWAIPVGLVAVFAVAVAGRLRASIVREPALSTGSIPAAVTASVLRAPRMWSVTGFFGCQALIYFAITAWLPTIAVGRGLDATSAGLLLAWMSLAGIPSALLAPTIAARFRSQTGVILVVSLLSAIGLTGVAFAPVGLAPLFVAVLGVAQSAAFGLAVGLIVARAPDAARTSAFSAVAQGFGYALAALGPLALGLLASSGIAWTPLVAGLLAVVVAQLAFGLVAGRPISPRERRSAGAHRRTVDSKRSPMPELPSTGTRPGTPVGDDETSVP